MSKKTLVPFIILFFIFSFGVAKAENFSTSTSFQIDQGQMNLATGTPAGLTTNNSSGKNVRLPVYPTINGNKPVFDGGNTQPDNSNNVTLSQNTEASQSKISVTDIRLDKDQFKAGDIVTGTVTLLNKDSVDQNDVYLETALVGDYSKVQGRYGLPDSVYDIKTSGPFKAISGEYSKIKFSYQTPISVGGKGLGIEIHARSASGITYGWKDALLKEVLGGKQLLSIQDSYINIDGEKHIPESGPMVGGTSTINFHLVVKNPTNNSVTITPKIDVHNRLISGTLIKEYSDTAVTIKSGADYEFVFEPYKNNDIPGVYVQAISLVDGSGTVTSVPTQFRYILPGDIATIQEVKFDQKSVDDGDVVNVNVFYSGSPLDILTGKRHEISQGSLNVQIIDTKTSSVIGEATTTPDFTQEASNSKVAIKVKGSADTIQALVNISGGGKILATYKTSASDPDLNKVNDREVSNSKMMYIIILVIVAIIILGLILIFFKKKKGKNLLMVITLLLTVISVGIINQNIAKAYNVYSDRDTVVNERYGPVPTECAAYPYSTAPGCSCYESYAGRFISYICSYTPKASFNHINVTSLGSPWFTSGQGISVSGSVVNTGCQNTPENITVYMTVYDTAGNMLGQQSLPPHHYQNHVGYESSNTPYNTDFSFYIGGLNPGSYLINISTYEDWVGNGLWEQYGWRTERTNIYVYPPVSVDCSADKTTAKIGDTITWKANAHGGTATVGYTNYYWSGSEQAQINGTGWYLATKKYTTPGLKYMYSAVIDNYTGNNSAANNGGPWNICTNSVTVYAPVNVICSANKTDVTVGDSVTWNATTTGGSGTSVLSWKSGDTSVIGQNVLNSIIEKYTTVGVKTMSANAVDATASDSSGWKTCGPANVNVYTPVDVSCTVSSPGIQNTGYPHDEIYVFAGQPVTWKMTPTGGSGQYKKSWYNATDLPDWATSPDAVTLTKTYSTVGDKSMSVGVVDSKTGNSSRVNKGGWKSCDKVVHVINPVQASCSVVPTSIKTGESAKWTITAAKGVPTYKYQYSENSSLLSNVSSSVTRKYSSPGTKTMAYNVTDSIGNSTGWQQCPHDVTVKGKEVVIATSTPCTGPDGSTIEDGDTKRLYDSPTDKCSEGYQDFLCLHGAISPQNKVSIYHYNQCVTDCTLPNGETLKSGHNKRLYDNPTDVCTTGYQDFSCLNGLLNPNLKVTNYKYDQCQGSCDGPGGDTLINGQTKRYYKYTDHLCGNYADFTCTNGALSGGDPVVFTNDSCAADCKAPNGVDTITNGTTKRYYKYTDHLCGNYADFTCTNGTLSGGNPIIFTNASCKVVNNVTCTLPDGSILQDGELSQKYYKPNADNCNTDFRQDLCTKGVISPGDYAQYTSNVCNGGNTTCTLPDGTVLQSGYSQRYFKRDDNNCNIDFRDVVCTNGVITPGDYALYTSNVCHGIISTVVKPPVIVAFKVYPDTVNKGTPCGLTAIAAQSQSCTITANPTSSGGPYLLSGNASGDINRNLTSGPISGTTKFTLTCTGKYKNSAGNFPTVAKTATCLLNPSVIER